MSKEKPHIRDDEIVATLKARYFELAAKEDIPNTPELTRRVDQLECAIRDAQPKVIGGVP
jgi:hypothetical protein